MELWELVMGHQHTVPTVAFCLAIALCAGTVVLETLELRREADLAKKEAELAQLRQRLSEQESAPTFCVRCGEQIEGETVRQNQA